MFLVGVCDMYIFDEAGNLLHKINSLCDCTIQMSNYSGTIKATDTTFNFDLLSTIHGKTQEYKNDFEKVLNKDNKTVLECGLYNDDTKCQVILMAETRDNYSGVKYVKYVFPKCTFNNDYLLETASNMVSTTNININVHADDKGKMFNIVY
jgi:hypothetical protein